MDREAGELWRGCTPVAAPGTDERFSHVDDMAFAIPEMLLRKEPKNGRHCDAGVLSMEHGSMFP